MVATEPRVLVVDAEPFFRDSIQEMLTTAAIPCESVAGLDAALGWAAASELGVVLLDVTSPGLDAMCALIEERPELGVIALAAPTAQDQVLEALRLGACDYLAKPLHEEELVLSVRRALANGDARASRDALKARLQALEEQLRHLAGDGESQGRPAAQRAADAAAVLLDATRTSVLLLDDTGRELRVVAATGSEMSLEEMDPVALGASVAGVVLIDGAPLAVPDVAADPRFDSLDYGDQYRSSAFAVAPIPAEGRRLGVVCAADKRDRGTFDAEDVRLLHILALQLGPLLAAERRLAELAAQESAAPPAELPAPASADEDTQPHVASACDDAELARSICDVLTVEIEPERLVSAVVRAISSALPASPVALYLMDATAGELRLEGQWETSISDRERLPVDAGLTGTVFQTGRLMATEAPDRDPRFDPAVDTPEGGTTGSLLCVPVRLRGKTLGVLRAFPPAGAPVSARTGEVLTAAVSAAVRNVLLYRSLLESVDEVARARRETQSQPGGVELPAHRGHQAFT